MNEAALKGALNTVESLVGGVRRLVAEGVGRCKDRVQQQEALCLQDKDSVLQLLVRTGQRRWKFNGRTKGLKLWS